MPLPPKHILSKSTFMYGCQCSKRLWLHKFQPELKDEMTEEQAAIFQSGTDVGSLARDLFPYGVDASPAELYLYQQSVADTAKYIRKGVNTIYEAAFQNDGLLAAMDILVEKKGKWYAFEVKGTARVKEQHILDAALQYFVITQSGLPLEDISIIHLNTGYVRRGDLDLDKLFTSTSVLKEVKKLQPSIAEKAEELKAVLKLKEVPAVDVGDHCFTPYTCNFYGHCHQGLVEETEEEKEYINRKAIKEFLGQLEYPLHFMDFETWSSAVPEQDGHWPFRQVPFQFSMHIQQKEGADPEHKYYLAEGTQTPHLLFAEKLLEAVGKKGTVLVYNKTFENTILSQLKKEFAHLSANIEKLQERIVDLMTPFRKNYRLPSMQGSYSMKKVLPTLVPELSYDGMSIGEGADASAAFYNLKHVDDEKEKQATRKALLEYCELDTWGMVRILGKIVEG